MIVALSVLTELPLAWLVGDWYALRKVRVPFFMPARVL